jgi:hypothetical protein
MPRTRRTSTLKWFKRAVAGSEQTRPLRRRAARLPVATDELDLVADKQHQLCPWHELLPPGRGGAVGHQREAIAVGEELVQPRHQAVAPTGRRVRPDETLPLEGSLVFPTHCACKAIGSSSR